MTQDDILEMARSAGLTDGMELQHEIDALMRFAELLAAAARKQGQLTKKKVVYHYCSTKQIGFGKEVHIDGIMKLEKPVEDMNDYRALKEKIADNQDIGGGNGLIIVSLTELPSSTPKGEAE